MNKNMIILLVLLHQFWSGLSQTKIVDMHIHSYTQDHLDKGKPFIDYYGVQGAVNAEKLMLETFAAFKE